MAHLSIIHSGWHEHWTCNVLHPTGTTIGIALLGDPLLPVEGPYPVTALRSTAGGLHALAITGLTPQPIREASRIVGYWLEDADARYCWLGGIQPPNPRADRVAQATAIFPHIEQLLAQAGLDFSHVLRTWFYLDRILDWYGAFNEVRNAFFKARGIYDGLVPASTGIGAPNAAGTALVAKVFAVRPKTGRVYARRVDSPLQCAPWTYGSAFSRAVELTAPGSRQLFVSGTASIEPGGRTVHIGNTRAQIHLTLDVVTAILTEAGHDWTGTSRAIAYFRHAADIPLWNQVASERRLPPLPVIVTECDVCRDDLLFEIELDTVAT